MGSPSFMALGSYGIVTASLIFHFSFIFLFISAFSFSSSRTRTRTAAAAATSYSSSSSRSSCLLPSPPPTKLGWQRQRTSTCMQSDTICIEECAYMPIYIYIPYIGYVCVRVCVRVVVVCHFSAAAVACHSARHAAANRQLSKNGQQKTDNNFVLIAVNFMHEWAYVEQGEWPSGCCSEMRLAYCVYAPLDAAA